MRGKSTLLGSGITQLMSNLVKEVTLSKFFILLTLKNFLALTIWMILLGPLSFLSTLVISYKPFSLLSDCGNLIPSRYMLVLF